MLPNRDELRGRIKVTIDKDAAQVRRSSLAEKPKHKELVLPILGKGAVHDITYEDRRRD